MNHINAETLQADGYNKCPGDISAFKPGASNLFQKRFRNNSGETLYFINVYEFDFSEYVNAGRYPKDLPVRKYQAEAQFYRGNKTFDMSLHLEKDATISEMEEFFEEVFTNLKCDNDHHN